jgi:hypothetical protein
LHGDELVILEGNAVAWVNVKIMTAYTIILIWLFSAPDSITKHVGVAMTILLQTYIECFFHGNILKKQALHIAKVYKDALVSSPLPLEKRPTNCVLKLPTGTSLLYKENCKTSCEKNSVAHVPLSTCLLGGCTVYYVWEPRAFMTPPKNPLVYERLYV